MLFDHILLDPSWPVAQRRETRQDGKRPRFGIGASGRYETISMEDIVSLQVADLAKPVCNLHCWSSSFALSDAMLAISQWRRTGEPDKQVFYYKGVETVWIKLCQGRARWKLHKLAKELFRLGLVGFLDWIVAKNPGNYFANNVEFCLIATTRNGIQPERRLGPQLLFHPKIKPHSRKPDQVRQKIESFYPGQDYIELFATQTHPGWASLGLEIDGRRMEDSIPWMLQREEIPPYQRETMSEEFRQAWMEKVARRHGLQA